MNNKTLILTTVALAMIGLTAGYLARAKNHHVLLPPGVKLVSVPVLDEEHRIARTNSVYMPSNLSGWHATSEPISLVELGYLPRDTIWARVSYQSLADGFVAQANAVLMGSDRSSIHLPEYCLTGLGWSIGGKSYTTVRIPRPHPYDLSIRRFDMATVKTLDGRSVPVKGIFLFWFVSDKLLTADHRERMWWMARDLLRHGTLQRWAYISYFAACRPGEEEKTFRRLTQLIEASVPEFQLTVPGPSLAGSP